MIKTGKKITVTVDGKVYTSTKAPECIDEFDGHCPACGSDQYSELYTIVQHGFLIDECVTLVTCAKCFETFHYWYEVEAPEPTEVIVFAFNQPSGG